MENSGIYHYLEALKATKKVVDNSTKQPMVFEVSIWSEEETNKIKKAILINLKLN